MSTNGLWTPGNRPRVADGRIIVCLVTVQWTDNYVTQAEIEREMPGEDRLESQVIEAWFTKGQNDVGDQLAPGWYADGLPLDPKFTVVAWMRKPAPFIP